jgi:acetyltransferase-like isoleucine patch superfamily enzyme
MRDILEAAVRRSPADNNRALLGNAPFSVDLEKAVESSGDNGNISLGVETPHEVIIQQASGGNVVCLGNIASGRVVIEIKGSNNLVYVGDTRKFQGRIHIEGDNNVFAACGGTTCNRAAFALASDGCSIILGDDCMLSMDVSVRASDMHPIYRLTTGERVNPPVSVLLESHVWIGERVAILKGVTVGAGSIVGSASVVNKAIPPGCLAVGTPAKVVDEDVTWLRNDNNAGPRLARLRRFIEAAKEQTA